jgi:hypothetical protein
MVAVTRAEEVAVTRVEAVAATRGAKVAATQVEAETEVTAPLAGVAVWERVVLGAMGAAAKAAEGAMEGGVVLDSLAAAGVAMVGMRVRGILT